MMIDNGKFQGESKCGMVPIHEAEDSLLMGGQGRALLSMDYISWT